MENDQYKPTDGDLVYKTSRWQRYLYDGEFASNQGLIHNSKNGSDRAHRYPDFQREVFSRLYSPRTPQMDEPAEDSAWAQQLHDQAQELPEFRNLQARTKGDEVWAGMATAAISKTLTQTMKPRETNKDLDKMRRKLEALKEMADQGIDVQARVDKAQAQLTEAKEEAEAMAAGMDPTAIRSALRKACTQAQEDINGKEEEIQALSYGSDAGTPTSLANADQKRKLAECLKQNPKIQRIAQMAGRLRRVALHKQKSKCEHAQDEIDNIEQGADIDRLLPDELAMLVADDEDLEAMFYARLAERKCLQYHLKGREEEGRGPIVCCVDVSGSMQGDPEVWAKAVCLALLDVARRQKRSWALIQFDSQVQNKLTFRKGEEPTTQELIDTLTFFTGGGTSFEAPLDEACQQITEDGELKKADILLVTDGAAPLGEKFLARFKEYRERMGVNLITVLVNPKYHAGPVQEMSDHVYTIADILQNDDAFNDVALGV